MQYLEEYNYQYEKYSFFKEALALWSVFSDLNIEENCKNYKFSIYAKKIINNLEIGINRNYNCYNYVYTNSMYLSEKSDKDILICISGGKDSLATILKYKELGYNIRLYTLKGINKGYPEEYLSAEKVAKELNLPIYIDNIKITGKKFFTEHPLKNIVIASCALACCLENNITPNIAFGDYKEKNNKNSTYEINWSDNYSLWECYNLYIKNFIPNANVEVIFTTPLESNEVLLRSNNLKKLFSLIQSCLITVRFRGKLRRGNEEKYKIKLPENRCGSCRKCCYEYIFLADNNIVDYNEEYYKHCLEVLKKKYVIYKNTIAPKDLRDTYLKYFNDISKSKYFE